jgi:AAA15 family ATPase/GTPase
MKIKRIHVKNVKAIIDQEINLNGATAILCGGNNKGKSTLLTALKDRLLKMKADQIVRRGETEGLYEMEFTSGDIIQWELSTKTKAGEKLTLISKDGAKTSVITDIIKWFNPGSFDIDKFLNESPAAQRKTLEKLLGLDFSTLDEQYTKAVEERKDANRDVERIEVTYKGLYVDETLPKEIAPTEELEKELLGVETHNEKYRLLTEQEKSLLATRKRLEEELAAVNAKLAELDEKLFDAQTQPKSQEYVNDLTEKLRTTKESNIKIEANNRLREALKSLEVLKDTAHNKDIAVKDILKAKDDMIRAAKMPEGFSFGEEGINYNDLPLTAQQLSSSAIYIAALKLASIQVGNVRFLHFDASMLDNKSLDEVRKWAESQDLQLGIELVDRAGQDISYELIEDNWLDS